jgi:diguanylate cyclase (GGDEF)-like protein
MTYSSNTVPVAITHPSAAARSFALSRVVATFALPVALLVLARIAAPFVAHLPPPFESLPVWGPVWALVLAGTLALVFNRGRLVFAVLCLALAYASQQAGLLDPQGDTAQRIVFAALCVGVPLNLAVLALLRERGLFNFYGARRFGLILLQALVVAWAVSAERTDLADLLYLPLLPPASLLSSEVPQLALALMSGAIVLMVARAVAGGSALDAGLAAALACFALASQGVMLPNQFALFTAAGAAALVAAILQDAFRLAFRDELTGLPSRRALNERLLTLGARYTIAMVDVDHFKQFNDRYGHDLGDHVLRMVAAKLRTVGGGGRAYRYGGEEFTLLFPSRRIHDAWPHLEALREQIGAHPMVLRAPAGSGEDSRGASGARQPVHVTVSIGVAERGERNAAPGAVLRAADKALYRAKDKGRDRVSL